VLRECIYPSSVDWLISAKNAQQEGPPENPDASGRYLSMPTNQPASGGGGASQQKTSKDLKAGVVDRSWCMKRMSQACHKAQKSERQYVVYLCLLIRKMMLSH